MSLKIIPASILTALNAESIGTKVTDQEGFMGLLPGAIVEHNTSRDRAPGQHFIMLPQAIDMVSCGEGRKEGTTGEDYVVRMHRGQPTMFLKRKHAVTATGVAAILYTREAYLADPDIAEHPKEQNRIQNSEATHVLVAVLAFGGPKAPLTPYRLVHNLAGGNNEVESWTKEDILIKAKESKEYWDEWAVVAD